MLQAMVCVCVMNALKLKINNVMCVVTIEDTFGRGVIRRVQAWHPHAHAIRSHVTCTHAVSNHLNLSCGCIHKIDCMVSQLHHMADGCDI